MLHARIQMCANYELQVNKRRTKNVNISELEFGWFYRLSWILQVRMVWIRLLIARKVTKKSCGVIHINIYTHLPFQILDKRSSQVSSLLPPGCCLQCFIAHRVQQSHC